MAVYYAFEHTHGADNHRNKSAIGTLHVFKTDVARARWIEGGSADYSLPGYRNFVVAAYAEKWLAGGGAVVFEDD